MKDVQIKKYFAGIDFGWEHYGSIALVAQDINNNYYFIKEIAYKHKHIDWWINEAKKIIKEYGDINFYCDHARPDYINKLRQNQIKAINARKDVLAGIGEIASLFKTRRLKVIEEFQNPEFSFGSNENATPFSISDKRAKEIFSNKLLFEEEVSTSILFSLSKTSKL